MTLQLNEPILTPPYYAGGEYGPPLYLYIV